MKITKIIISLFLICTLLLTSFGCSEIFENKESESKESMKESESITENFENKESTKESESITESSENTLPDDTNKMPDPNLPIWDTPHYSAKEIAEIANPKTYEFQNTPYI